MNLPIALPSEAVKQPTWPTLHRHHPRLIPLSQGTRSRPSGLCESMRATKGRQNRIGASPATKKFHPASEASKTWAWPVVALTWDNGINLSHPHAARRWPSGGKCDRIVLA